MTRSTACIDWESRIVEGRSLIVEPPLFPAEAQAALDVFTQLRVVDVAGSPPMGEICRPWILDFVATLFGSYDSEAGRRLISEYLLLVSKKNSKSTLAAGIMMTALIRNWRQSGEFLILSPTVEIANNSFYPARDMVRADEELSDLFQVQDHIRQITHRGTGAMLKVVAAEQETVGGKKGIFVLVDELHLFGKKPGAENMLREATGGLASRPEGCTIFLTTQSDETPAGVFKSKLEYARGVRDGLIDDPKFLPVLYEYPKAKLENNGHKDPKNFYVTNPNLGASVDVEFLEREFKKAEVGGPESLCGFLAKHLNVEIGLALASNRWAAAPYWLAQADPEIRTLEQLMSVCDVVDIGIDGGGLDDLLGLSVLGRHKTTRKWIVWAHAWAYKDVLKLRKDIAPRLLDFQKDGDLTIVDTLGDDCAAVAEICARMEEAGLLDKIGVDPSGIGSVLDALIAAKVPEDKVIGISQGWKMTASIKTAERKLAEGAMSHCGQALMAWCVGNAKVESRGNAVIITKQISGAAKIDPVCAMLNAVALMSLNPAAPGKKYQMMFV